ncbi:hypothetical protein ZYGR_0AD03590 [Zygosaccharomyces rouxii]|uniref:ZYRO0G14454p n=2 Tax=Zygosaccharomyces rouxii TaxID=4956 RepID=C5E0P1_ZYGRC|nr:uncharacterized protein ZYRO0G14454g [Zygosaccharomyces rouxii]KAH9202669.1 hypothetical protein LQ764DRAFT_222790 [Zygosaccharomyces rouxii]GAV51176.1 hypothetical protein ZYGR_0AD03590 [Zygosaccharomyces rouxii]CAR29675.1 ZYRO0G14454p [Zygosaccharomyces rouxii]
MVNLDYSSDSDSAPEEEGLDIGQQEVQLQLREREDAQRREQKILKEQRRKQDEMFRRQREEKDSKIGTDSLEEMPTELLESLARKEQETQVEQPTKRAAQRHISFEDELDEAPAAKGPSRKKNKLAMLRAKRGPVMVQVLSQSSQLPPKVERPVMKDRDKWLKRKGLRRK